MRVAVIGASDNPARYSYQALLLLKEQGHQVIPIHPRLTQIEGLPVLRSVVAISDTVDTVTLYIGRDRSDALIPEIVALNPRRIIMNPGAENETLAMAAGQAGIKIVLGCTIVMLKTGQF